MRPKNRCRHRLQTNTIQFNRLYNFACTTTKNTPIYFCKIVCKNMHFSAMRRVAHLSTFASIVQTYRRGISDGHENRQQPIVFHVRLSAQSPLIRMHMASCLDSHSCNDTIIIKVIIVFRCLD